MNQSQYDAFVNEISKLYSATSIYRSDFQSVIPIDMLAASFDDGYDNVAKLFPIISQQLPSKYDDVLYIIRRILRNHQSFYGYKSDDIWEYDIVDEDFATSPFNEVLMQSNSTYIHIDKYLTSTYQTYGPINGLGFTVSYLCLNILYMAFNKSSFEYKLNKDRVDHYKLTLCLMSEFDKRVSIEPISDLINMMADGTIGNNFNEVRANVVAKYKLFAKDMLNTHKLLINSLDDYLMMPTEMKVYWIYILKISNYKIDINK